ncbi:hypothetical protein EXS56_02330 [Candidatus Kaiserbacteria bacterium]|nr:hypothetical protein [Candidatus Kaiserbacteria bacterium]
MKNSFLGQHNWRHVGGAILASALLGFLAYTAIVDHIAYGKSSRRLQNALSALSADTLIRYGTVVSANTTTGDITIQSRNQLVTGSETEELQVTTTPSTILIREELNGGLDGTFTARSISSPGSLSEIVSGTRVRIYGVPVGLRIIKAQAIVYGNPL